MKTDTLTPDLLQKMDAYWRAANYLSVGLRPRHGCPAVALLGQRGGPRWADQRHARAERNDRGVDDRSGACAGGTREGPKATCIETTTRESRHDPGELVALIPTGG